MEAPRHGEGCDRDGCRCPLRLGWPACCLVSMCSVLRQLLLKNVSRLAAVPGPDPHGRPDRPSSLDIPSRWLTLAGRPRLLALALVLRLWGSGLLVLVSPGCLVPGAW